MPFADYMEKWLNSVRPSIATATYQSYSIMMKAGVIPYFKTSAIQLGDLSPQHIEDFYQTILNDGCTANTVIHYHAIIRKALQSAVKKDILPKNPADKVERPQKNVFHGNCYSEDEMLDLFDAIAGDPLELCVKIAAYYGLRRSEALGHSTSDTTADIYSHLDLNSKQSSAKAIASAFEQEPLEETPEEERGFGMSMGM